LEQIGNQIKFVAFFTDGGEGKTGLTVTVDVRNPAGTLIQTGIAATEIGGGLYSHTLTSGSTTTEGEYTAIFKTAGTVDQAHLPSLWSIGRAGIECLDATITSVSGGSGSIEYTETVTDENDNPLDGVAVTVRPENNVAATATASGTTNAFGEVTFYLDPGTYWIWCQRAGTNFDNPTEIEVS
jgi:hypothetical protein